MKRYAPIFLGQFGYLFSMPMVVLSRRIAALGYESEVFEYGQFEPARQKIIQKLRDSYEIDSAAFSLGNTTLTLLQLTLPFGLVCCIAQSTLAGNNNRPINHRNVLRSVLYRGPGVLSSANSGGFDQVKDYGVPHLMMPVAAMSAVLNEFKRRV